MKIGFVTDTNFLKGKDDFVKNGEKFLTYADYFVNYIESLSNVRRRDKLIYFMPNIIVEELYNQKIMEFQKRYDSLKERFEELQFALEGEIPKNNIINVLDDIKEKYKEKFEILELQYTEEIFKELVNDALKKKPPFDKSEQKMKTDSGYKDALIWKTVLYSEKIDECDKIYFFSCDNVFKENSKELEEEFKRYHEDVEIKIVNFEPNGKQREHALELLISENNLVRTDLIKLYDKNLIIEQIKLVKYNYENEVKLQENDYIITLNKIDFDNFTKKDFYIENVMEENGIYVVKTYINTKCFSLIENKDTASRVTAKVSLNFKKEKSEFKLTDFQIRNVRLKRDLVFNEIVSNIVNYLVEISSKNIKDSMKNFSEIINKTIISNEIDKMFHTYNLLNETNAENQEIEDSNNETKKEFGNEEDVNGE